MTNEEIVIAHPVTGEPMDKSTCKRVITQLFEQRETLEKQLDGLRDQIMNLPCVVPVQLMTRNDIQIYGWGYVTARKEAAELVAGIMAGKEEE